MLERSSFETGGTHFFLEKGRRCVDVEKFNGNSNGSSNISHYHKNNCKQF